MSLLSHERRCREIVAQTELLVSTIDGADLTVPAPSCPGWNVGQLLRHLGHAQRWAEEIVRTRTTDGLSDRALRELGGYRNEDPEIVGPWLAEGAAALAATLREAGPDTDVWTPVAGGKTAFYTRRFTHETTVHRADATLALGKEFAVDQDVAVDGIDEWLELSSRSADHELLGPGRTIHLHATDTDAEWVVDLTGDAVTWRRAHEKSAVAVRAPVADLLLLIYKRRPAGEIFGEAELLDLWLERHDFG
jgi:uncharacterized protein (TIGR03083 family)